MNPDPYLAFIFSTVTICLLVAAANMLLAARSIGAGAAKSFAVAFSLIATTWALAAILPQNPATADLSLLLLNGMAALGMVAMWCGMWLRAGYVINWWFMGLLLGIWVAPVLGLVLSGTAPGSHVPYAVISISTGASSGMWLLLRKRGTRNAGDWALILWIMFVLPISIASLMLGMSSARIDPTEAWIYYLAFQPTLLCGVGIFTLLGFTLDALRDSRALARSDGLTGLLNRRAFDSALSVSLARAERYQRDLSLMILDIDFFKQLNDSFGHPAGDAVIRAVARLLAEQSRSIDVVARIGGEEFALILPDTPASAALRLAERLREAIVDAGGVSMPFTASFGVSSVQDTGFSSDALVKSADDALYAAKKSGRNCVRYARDPERDISELINLVHRTTTQTAAP